MHTQCMIFKWSSGVAEPKKCLQVTQHNSFALSLCIRHLRHAPSVFIYLTYTTFLPFLIDSQVVGECEADIKRLQEQLAEANQANEASGATQANQSQSSLSTQASDSGDDVQALQGELAKLRQEVLPHQTFQNLVVIQLLF